MLANIENLGVACIGMGLCYTIEILLITAKGLYLSSKGEEGIIHYHSIVCTYNYIIIAKFKSDSGL